MGGERVPAGKAFCHVDDTRERRGAGLGARRPSMPACRE
jgi:hypothetical protein